MSTHNKEIWILSAKRTPFGALSGALKRVSAIDLAAHASKAAIEASSVAPEDFAHVVLGNVQQTSPDALYGARHVGLKAGLPIEVPAITVNRLCGSGFQAIVTAAEQILLGHANVVLAAGAENMSQAPHAIWGMRDGAKFGRPPKLVDTLWESLTDTFSNTPMAVTAENLAEKYGIDRDACDAYAIQSQERWAAADQAGAFKDEITPIEVRAGRKTMMLDRDEHPRPDTTREALAKLPPVFKKDGVVTAGNASGICDGAAALVVADAEWAKERGLEPLARLVSWGVAGVEPTLMGIGPVPATKIALERAGVSISDIDLFDVNEAFAPQFLAVQRELELPNDRLNVNGGAIALGHPLGATGARIATNLIHTLRQQGKSKAIGSACIGGGQGIAMLLEAL